MHVDAGRHTLGRPLHDQMPGQHERDADAG